MTSFKKLLSSSVIIVALAMLLRLVYLYSLFHVQLVPKNNRYLIGYETGSIAASLASGQGYSSPLSEPTGPTAWITPVYPILLAAIFKIFGTFTLKASYAARVLNVIFSALTCLPIRGLGRRLFGDSVGLTAAWIWVFLPYAVFFSVVWIWDTSLSALILTTALCATYAIEESSDARVWAGFGAVWAFTTLVNAAVISILPFCLLFAFYRSRQKRASWAKLALYAVAAFSLTVSPWIIRNEVIFHGKVFLRSNFGLELWLGNNPQVPDTWTWWLHPTDNGEERAKFVHMGELPYMQAKQAEAWQFIKTHPNDFSRFLFHRFMETWTGNHDSFADIWSSGVFLLRGNLLINYSLPLLSFIGLFLARRSQPSSYWPLLATMALFPVVYYVCHTTPRYRHPIDPVIVVLGSYSVVFAVRAVREKFIALPAKATPEAVRTA